MIEKIKLYDVRCFKQAEFDFSGGVNLLSGRNGAGKTTLLESIGFFAFGSYQSVPRDSFVIRDGAELSRLEIELSEPRARADAVILKGSKLIKINEQKSPNSALVGFMRAVLFNPATIDLVDGQPSVRRRELDVVIAQKKGKYIRLLLQYKQAIRQRNNLLKVISANRAREKELEFWNEQLFSLGGEIYRERASMVEVFNGQLRSLHSSLVGRESKLQLRYVTSCDYDRFDEEIARTASDDIRFGQTSVGPHRDDFVFEEGDFVLKEGGSRGEQRMAAVAFKVASRDYLSEGKRKPILLLDDIFSELDENRRESVAHILGSGFSSPGDHLLSQIFISATDERVIPEILKAKAATINLD